MCFGAFLGNISRFSWCREVELRSKTHLMRCVDEPVVSVASSYHSDLGVRFLNVPFVG